MLVAAFAAAALKSAMAASDTKLDLDAMASTLEGDVVVPAHEV